MTKNILDADIFNIKVNDLLYLEFDMLYNQSVEFKCTDFVINDADEKNIKIGKSPETMIFGGKSTWHSWLHFLVAGTYTIYVICPAIPIHSTNKILCSGEKYMKTIIVV